MLAQKPPMGWNTWNTFGENINEQLIKESADAFIKLGLKDAGYEYLVIDDCWSEYDRDPVTDEIVPHHEKFPNGMKVVADYVHSKGIKFGMYSCDGVRTCADYPGSFDHEYLDAKTFAKFGVDFLKYDNCYKPDTAQCENLYRRMGMALRASGREILFSACNWGTENVWQWIRSTGAHMYRSTGDINDSFESYRDIAFSQLDKLGYSAPGCYNDVDMLTVGMYGKGNVGTTGCTDADYRTQFSIWCMFSAPLMLGCDLRTMNEETLKLVTNKELIRIDQDEEARSPLSIREWDGQHLILFKFLANGEYALALYNLSERESGVSAKLTDLGLPVNSGLAMQLTNVFTGETEGTYKEYVRRKLAPHDCVVFCCKLVEA